MIFKSVSINQSSEYLIANIFEEKYAEAPFQFYEQDYQSLINWPPTRKAGLETKRAINDTYPLKGS